jgi:hypothetical protein
VKKWSARNVFLAFCGFAGLFALPSLARLLPGWGSSRSDLTDEKVLMIVGMAFGVGLGWLALQVFKRKS